MVLYTTIAVGKDGEVLGILKGWGDTAYHLDIIGVLAEGHPLRIEHPVAARTALTYPFFIDFVSAMFRKAGFSIFWSFQIPNLIFGILLLFSFWFLSKSILKKDILVIFCLAILLFGGGLGFWQFFKDLAAGSPFSHEYTHLDNRTGGKPKEMDLPLNIVWITPAISFFSHQRAFIPGAALGALILSGIFRSKWKWIIALGLLPIIHTHTFLAFLMIISTFFFIQIYFLKKDRTDLKQCIRILFLPLFYGILAALIALPQVLYLLSGKSSGAFFEFWPGWMAKGYENVIWFWTKNFGVVFWGWLVVLAWELVIPWLRKLYQMLGASLLQKNLPYKQSDFVPSVRLIFIELAIASVVIFLAANLIKFQPWEFDNNKILFWWWLLATIIVLDAIGRVIANKKKLGIILLIIFGFLATFSGFLDIAGRFIRISSLHFGYYGKEEIEIASWIKANTLSHDIFLTSGSANDFVPMLAGRPLYLGFSGWLWTQGSEKLLKERNEAIFQFLRHGNPQKICFDGVKYIVWDRQLEATYGFAGRKIVEEFSHKVFSAKEKAIYRLECKGYN